MAAIIGNDIGSDIETPALEVLTTIFTERLLAQGILKTLKLAPLQDDPTLTAPYFIFAPDPDKGIQPDNREGYVTAEIGGPVHYLHHFHGQCGTPAKKDRLSALSAINSLTTQVVKVISKYYDLNGLTSEDQELRIEGANPYLVLGTNTKIFGGGQEFYGKSVISWYYPVGWYNIGA